MAIAGFLTVFAAEVVLLWLVAGQALADAPAFLQNTWEIVAGYSQAMPRQVDVPAWQADAAMALAAIVSVALVVASAGGEYRDDRARRAGIAMVGLAAFAIFKEGVVRVDAGHLSLFFSTACVLWLALPWAHSRWRLMLAGAALIGLLGTQVRPPGPLNLNPIANVRYAGEQVRSLFSASRRAELSAEGRAAMKAIYRLDPTTVMALRGHSVAIDPWEIGVAWAYQLDWDPLPVFQHYSAYTSGLDRLNASAVSDPAGPERILRENPALVYPEFPTRGIDNRFPAWDPPAEARAILCHFVALHTTARWQVLARTANRCGRPRPVGAVEVKPDTTVTVPAVGPHEVVFARIVGADIGGLDRVIAFALRAPARHVIIDGKRSYRLIPSTAADGLLLNGSNRLGGRGAFAQIPHAKTIAVTGTSSSLRIDFFRMRVRSLPPPDG